MTVALLWTVLVLWAVVVTWLVLLCSLELYWWVGDGGMGREVGVGRQREAILQYNKKHYYIIKFLRYIV